MGNKTCRERERNVDAASTGLASVLYALNIRDPTVSKHCLGSLEMQKQVWWSCGMCVYVVSVVLKMRIYLNAEEKHRKVNDTKQNAHDGTAVCSGLRAEHRGLSCSWAAES